MMPHIHLQQYIGGLLLIGLMLPAPARAVEPDWQGYARILRMHVSEGVRDGVTLATVDYPAIRQDSDWPRLLGMLAGFDPASLKGKKERLAFYINAYNILAIKMVLDHWPLKSIRDAGSLLSPVWKKPAGIIGGKQYSLDSIEHGILRPMGEPRIHFAIVCASASCPDLRSEPYRAEKLDAQLNDQTKRFLKNPLKGMQATGNRFCVSRIFNWFEKDFESSGGVVAFIHRYRPDISVGALRITYLPYNWTLN